MSFGVALRNALALGLGGIISLRATYVSAPTPPPAPPSLLTENGDYLVQENGGRILLE